MRCAILAFAAGTAVLQTFSSLPGQDAIGGLAGAGILLCCLRRLPAVVAGAFLLGLGWAALLATSALSRDLDQALEGRDIVVTGVIDNLPHEFPDGMRFRFLVEAASVPVPPKLMLGWYRQEGLFLLPGERWQMTIRLKRAHGNANPGGFDYEAWLLEQGVRATGYVRSGRRIDSFVFSPINVIERWRASLRSFIRHQLGERRYADVIVALVVGDQRGIDQTDWTVFNRTGISHLVSISGLHITMIAGLCAWVASALWRRSFFTRMQLPLLIPAQKVALLAGTCAALFYVALAGFGVPAQRTLYMLLAVALALWAARLPGVSHILCLALGVVVLLDPWASMWPGFWLSFGAVAVILYAAGQPARGWRGTVALAVRTQWSVTVGLVPLTMLLFAQVSIISPVANALAIPVVSFIVTPFALLGSLVPGAGRLLLLAHWSMEVLATLLTGLSTHPLAVWTAPAPSWAAFLFALAGTVWMLSRVGGQWRHLGCLSWLPMLLARPAQPPENSVALTFFDVGQGSAILVETHRHRLLVDTGPAYTLEANGGNRVILPYLRQRGIGKLDGIVITHSDLDHSGGAKAVMDGVQAGWVLSSMDGYRRCQAGQQWGWDGIRFEIMHPASGDYVAGQKPNAISCVLSIRAAGRHVLLTGDIEAPQEAALIARYGPALKADILLAPHHGSGTSSTAAFLKVVQPAAAVFQVGYRNRYQHPKAQVLARYGAAGIGRLRTDEWGAVTVNIGTALEVTRYREEHRRYWY